MRDRNEGRVNEMMDANVNVNVPADGPRNPVVNVANPDPVNQGPQNIENVNVPLPMGDNEINEAIQAARNAVRAAAVDHRNEGDQNPRAQNRNEGRQR